MTWWLVGSIAVAIVLYVAWTYNRLVALGRRADGAWSDIDVQLKRRWDLVPALVAAVKGYTQHESSTLESVTGARARAESSGSIANRGESELGLSRAVVNVLALAEAYPDLKADQTFLKLQQSLVEIEDNVQYARRYYNAVVRDFNTQAAGFPALLVARPAGFAERSFFQAEEGERVAPEVRL